MEFKMKKRPKDGDKRIRRRFFIIPRRIGTKYEEEFLVWLESRYVEEVYRTDHSYWKEIFIFDRDEVPTEGLVKE